MEKKADTSNQVFLRCSRCRSKRLSLRIPVVPSCIFIECCECGTLSLLGEFEGSFSPSKQTITGIIQFEKFEVS